MRVALRCQGTRMFVFERQVLPANTRSVAGDIRFLGCSRTVGMGCAVQMQGDVHHVALARDGAGKAQLIEHAQSPPIVRQGMRVKVRDAGIAGDERQMTQHR